MLTIKKSCPVCQGSGSIPAATGQGDACVICDETGYVEIGEIDVSDITDKLDAIIAEQASQREDLTTALTQIWNKVKDL